MEAMKCPNCGEELDPGAAFCGNCGQPIAMADGQPTKPAAPIADVTATPTIGQVWARSASVSPRTRYPGTLAVAGATGIPAYAIPVASEQTNAIKAAMSVVLGVAGTVASLFIPLAGLALGVAGLVLATVSRRTLKRRLNLVGIILSIICILTAFGSWAYVVTHDPNHTPRITTTTSGQSPGPAVAAQSVATPCYAVNFGVRLTVQTDSGSCTMNAFNGDSLNDSSDAYKVYGTTSSVTAVNFTNLAKQAIEDDVRQSLPAFAVANETAGQFAGSPAYFVSASNGSGISVMEAAVFHKTANGENFFVFVHAVNAATVNLHGLEAGWSWED
jgi:zinc ribbon protein